MAGRDADFVDPELRRGLVRMQVHYGADKTDDKVILQRDDEAMARVFKEFLSRGFNDGIVEDLCCDVVEDMQIGRGEEFERKHEGREIGD